LKWAEEVTRGAELGKIFVTISLEITELLNIIDVIVITSMELIYRNRFGEINVIFKSTRN